MDYICTFLVYLIEMLQKHYLPELRKEVTLPSGNGCRQKYKPERIFTTKRKRIFDFIINETQLKVGNNYFWIWIAIESSERTILGVRIYAKRNMFVAEQFLSSLVQEYEKHPVSTDGGTWYPSQACKYLKLRHHIHSAYEKSL